jgi:hypothetical protein
LERELRAWVLFVIEFAGEKDSELLYVTYSGLPVPRRQEGTHMNRIAWFVLSVVFAIPMVGAEGLEPSKPSDVATVFHGTTGTPACSFGQFDTQVGADGNPVPFSIPAGSVFVITEIELHLVTFGPPGQSDSLITISSSTGLSFWGSVPVLYDAVGNANTRIRITPTPVNAPPCLAFNTIGGSHARLHGFFMKNQ